MTHALPTPAGPAGLSAQSFRRHGDIQSRKPRAGRRSGRRPYASLARLVARKFGPMTEDAVSSPKGVTTGGSDELSARIEALVVEWAQVIRTAARRYGLSHADLDEVRQDVRLRLWHVLERIGDREVNASYGYRAASSAAIDLVRRHRNSRGSTGASGVEAIAGPAGDETLMATRLREALAVVPESRRAAVRLHLNGHSLADVARVLHWTPAQARNQVYRGLADLKRALQGAGRDS